METKRKYFVGMIVYFLNMLFALTKTANAQNVYRFFSWRSLCPDQLLVDASEDLFGAGLTKEGPGRFAEAAEYHLPTN